MLLGVTRSSFTHSFIHIIHECVPWFIHSLTRSFVSFHFISVSFSFSFISFRSFIHKILHRHFAIPSFLHSFLPSFIHSFIQSFIYSFILACMHSFLHSFMHAFMESCHHSFVHSFVQPCHSFIHSFVRSFVRSFIHWFIQSVNHSFIRSLTHSFISFHFISFHFTSLHFISFRSFIHSFIHTAEQLGVHNRAARAQPSKSISVHRRANSACTAEAPPRPERVQAEKNIVLASQTSSWFSFNF